MDITDIQPAQSGSKVVTTLKFLFFLGLGIVIIWLSLRNLTPVEKQEIIHSFRIANYYWVILVILLGVISHFFRSLRWILLMETMGYKPSVKNTFYAVMVGYFANLAFPRLGEVTRCGILSKYEKVPFNKGFGTVITERAFDMIIFALLFILMFFTQLGIVHSYLEKNIYPGIQGKFSNLFSNPIVVAGMIGLAIFLIVLFLIFRKKLLRSKIYHKIEHLVIGFWEGLKSLAQLRRPVLFLSYTAIIWTLYFCMLYFCFFCFSETSLVGPGAGLSALVLGTVSIMITPGGIGLYPAIVQETLILYGVTNTTGLALGWITWSAQTLMILIVGGISLIMLSFNKNRNDKTRSDQI